MTINHLLPFALQPGDGRFSDDGAIFFLLSRETFTVAPFFSRGSRIPFVFFFFGPDESDAVGSRPLLVSFPARPLTSFFLLS